MPAIILLMPVEIRASFIVDIVKVDRLAVAQAVRDYGQLSRNDPYCEKIANDTEIALDCFRKGLGIRINILTSDGQHFINCYQHPKEDFTRLSVHPGDLSSVEPLRRTAELLEYMAQKYLPKG